MTSSDGQVSYKVVVGHSYFMNLKDTDDLRFAWYHHVVPLLQEYFYNDGERLRAVVGNSIVVEQRAAPGIFEVTPENFHSDVPRFDISKFEGDDEGFLNALRVLAGQ